MTQIPLSQKTKRALLFSINKILQGFDYSKVEKTKFENSLKATQIFFVATLVTFPIKDIKKFNKIGKKSVAGIISFYKKYDINQEKIEPVMNEFFKRMESVTHNQIAGLVSSKDYKSLMKVAVQYESPELQQLASIDIALQFKTNWRGKIQDLIKDRKGRRLAIPLCEIIQRRVNRYIKKELKLFLNTVQI